MSHARTFAGHVAWSLTNTLLSGVLFYALRIVLYHRLPTEEYAHFYTAMALVMILHPILSVGFDPGLASFIARLREEGRFGLMRSLLLNALAVELLVGVVAAALLALLSVPLAQYVLNARDAWQELRVLGFYLAALLLYKLALTVLLGFQHIATRSGIELLRAVGILVLAWWWVQPGGRAVDTAFVYVFATTLAAVTGMAAIVALRPQLLRSDRDRQPGLLMEVFRSGSFASVAFGGILVFSQMDTLMLSVVRTNNEAAVASYQVASPTYMILYTLLIALANNFMPMAAVLAKRGEFDRLSSGVTDIYRLAAGTILPVSGGMAVFSPLLIETLFQSRVTGAAACLAVLTGGSLFGFTAYFNLHALTGLGATSATAAAVLWGVVANAFLNIVFITLLNAPGAALATVVSGGLVTILSWRSLRKHLLLAFPFMELCAGFTGGVLVALVCLGLQRSSLYGLWPLPTAVLGGAISSSAVIIALNWLGLCPISQVLRGVIRPGS